MEENPLRMLTCRGRRSTAWVDRPPTTKAKLQLIILGMAWTTMIYQGDPKVSTPQVVPTKTICD